MADAGNAQAKSDTEVEEWLSFYPKGTPPKEAKDAEGDFFRIVKSNPPSKDCFRSMFETNPKRTKKFKDLELKCTYGLSVYSEQEAVVNAFDKFPEGTSDCYVAIGTVSPGDGKMMKTFVDPAHFTLWLRSNHKIHTKFSCVRGLSK